MGDLDELARAAGNAPQRQQLQPVTRRLGTAAEFIVHDRGREWGPYSEAEIADYMADGRFTSGAHARHVAGGLNWFRLTPEVYAPPEPATPAAPVYVTVSTHVTAPRPATRPGRPVTKFGAAVLLLGIPLTCVFAPVGLVLMAFGAILLLVGVIVD